MNRSGKAWQLRRFRAGVAPGRQAWTTRGLPLFRSSASQGEDRIASARWWTCLAACAVWRALSDFTGKFRASVKVVDRWSRIAHRRCALPSPCAVEAGSVEAEFTRGPPKRAADLEEDAGPARSAPARGAGRCLPLCLRWTFERNSCPGGREGGGHPRGGPLPAAGAPEALRGFAEPWGPSLSLLFQLHSQIWYRNLFRNAEACLITWKSIAEKNSQGKVYPFHYTNKPRFIYRSYHCLILSYFPYCYYAY